MKLIFMLAAFTAATFQPNKPKKSCKSFFQHVKMDPDFVCKASFNPAILVGLDSDLLDALNCGRAFCCKDLAIDWKEPCKPLMPNENSMHFDKKVCKKWMKTYNKFFKADDKPDLCKINLDSSVITSETHQNYFNCLRAGCCDKLELNGENACINIEVGKPPGKPPKPVKPTKPPKPTKPSKPSKPPGEKKPCKNWVKRFAQFFGKVDMCAIDLDVSGIDNNDILNYFNCHRAWCCEDLEMDKSVCNGLEKPVIEKPAKPEKPAKACIKWQKTASKIPGFAQFAKDLCSLTLNVIQGAVKPNKVDGFLCGHAKCCENSFVNAEDVCKMKPM